VRGRGLIAWIGEHVPGFVPDGSDVGLDLLGRDMAVVLEEGAGFWRDLGVIVRVEGDVSSSFVSRRIDLGHGLTFGSHGGCLVY
jgi:hypothetical protein